MVTKVQANFETDDAAGGDGHPIPTQQDFHIFHVLASNKNLTTCSTTIYMEVIQIKNKTVASWSPSWKNWGLVRTSNLRMMPTNLDPTSTKSPARSCRVAGSCCFPLDQPQPAFQMCRSKLQNAKIASNSACHIHDSRDFLFFYFFSGGNCCKS